MDGYLERDWGKTRWARGNLKAGLGEAADLSFVDLRSVLLPWFRKSMSSLPSRLSLACPKPNQRCSIQSCDFPFLKVCFWGIAFCRFRKAINRDAPNEGLDTGPLRQA